MADNVLVDPGTGVGAVPVAADEVSGILYQTIKIATGADGIATLISAANPLPIGERDAGPTTAQTLRVSIASEQVEVGKYEAVPSTVSTTTTLGPTTGAIGDFLSSLLVTPLTVNPGSISIKDGSDAAILVFQGGTASVSNLVPFSINLGVTSRTGAWQVVTGSGGNVQALASGNFT